MKQIDDSWYPWVYEKSCQVVQSICYSLDYCQCRNQGHFRMILWDALKVFCWVVADKHNREIPWSVELVEYVYTHPHHWKQVAELLDHVEYAPVDWKNWQPPNL